MKEMFEKLGILCGKLFYEQVFPIRVRNLKFFSEKWATQFSLYEHYVEVIFEKNSPKNSKATFFYNFSIINIFRIFDGTWDIGVARFPMWERPNLEKVILKKPGGSLCKFLSPCSKSVDLF